MTRPLGTTGKAKTLDAKQLRTFLKRIPAIYTDKHQNRNLALISCSYLLGLRAMELKNLNIGDVFEPDGKTKEVLMLTAPNTKNQIHRDLFISNSILKSNLIKLYEHDLAERDRSEPLFQSQKSSRFSANSIQQLIKRIHEKCGYTDGFSSHSGRRSLITNLVHAGFDIHSISKIAGHSSVSTTQIYVDTSPAILSNILKQAF